MSFRDNLQHLRATRNMTQEQLAMLVGVSRQSVTKWEAEKSYPEMDKLLKLCQIFECSLDELVSGDLTDRPAAPAAAAVPAGPPTDVCGYDEHMRRFAWRMATGVALILLGVAGTVLAAWVAGGGIEVSAGLAPRLGVSVPASSAALEALSHIPLLGGIIAGLALMVPAGIEHAGFCREHPFIEDFYTAEDRRRASSRLATGVVVGIGCILAGMVVCAALDGASAEDAGAAFMLACVAAGVWCFVYFGIMYARVDVAAYNKEALEDLDEAGVAAASGLTETQRDELLARLRGPEGRRQRLISAACGIIMLVATAIALSWLFTIGASAGGNWGDVDWSEVGRTSLFWIPWPIGGICCGIASIVIETFYRER